MAEQPDLHRFALQRVGTVAHECLSRTGEGSVAALFKCSFYLRLGRCFVCIGSSAIGSGPLNATSTAPAGIDWLASGMCVGDPAVLRHGATRIGRRFQFDLSGATLWHPPRVSRAWNRDSLAAGLECFDRLLARQPPAAGLVSLLSGAKTRRATATLDLAAQPYARLKAWLARAMRDDSAIDAGGLEGVEILLGLGPGLTPSGDDLIAGALIVLHLLEKDQALGPLTGMIDRYAAERTSPLSAAHLDAAARGMATQAVHDVLAGLATGDVAGLPKELECLSRIGHTSGWDALTGMVTALRAWLESEPAI